MNALSFNGFAARFEFDAEDMMFVGRIGGIDDIVGFHAATVGDLQSAFHEAVDDYIDSCARIGKKPQKPYSGNLMLRVRPEIHSKVALAAEISGKSVNEWGEDVLAKAAESNLAKLGLDD